MLRPMPSPTVESLMDAAVKCLLVLPAAELHAVAVKKRVPFYPEDDILRPRLVKSIYPDARALRKALLAKDPVARRSALFLLTSADAASAWPILGPFVAKRAPSKAKGFVVVMEMAPTLVGTIPNIPEDELLPLFVNPRVEPNALVAGVLYHRESPEERLALLERVLGEKKNDGTSGLGEALVEELVRRTRGPLVAVLRGANHASWKAWVKDTLVAIGETAFEPASGPDAIALGPEKWHELEARFFSKKVLRTKAGREEAASILHSITTAVLLQGAKAWKKATSFVGYVDSIADAEGALLPRTAASLARVLRGKKPLLRQKGT
jgi:hypothetical protein